MERKRPWIVASATALAIAGLGTGYAVAGDGTPQSNLPGQIELTGVDADSANSPADSANSPAGSANSPAGSSGGSAASADSPAGKARGVAQDDDDDDSGGSADSPAPAQPAAPVRTHVPVTG